MDSVLEVLPKETKLKGKQPVAGNMTDGKLISRDNRGVFSTCENSCWDAVVTEAKRFLSNCLTVMKMKLQNMLSINSM